MQTVINPKEFDAVCPVFCKSDSGSLEHIGSGVLLMFHGLPLFLTVAHVADSLSFPNLFVPATNGFCSVAGPSIRLALPSSGKREDDPYDLAICRLTANTTSQIHPSKIFLTEANCDFAPQTAADSLFTFSGFPWRKSSQDQSRNIHYSDFFTFSGMSISHNLYKRYGYASESHIAVRFRRKKALNLHGNKITAPLPHGISGGGVFSFDQSLEDSKASPRIQLCGICMAYHASENIMVGTRITCFFGTLLDNIEYLLTKTPEESQ